MTDHYFSETPQVGSDPVSFRLPVDDDVVLDVETDSGVFSRGRLDKGTRVLLAHAPDPPRRGDLLDLGCGYGPIALVLAARRRRSTVWAVDVNSRALELTRRNASAAGLTNVHVCRPDEVPPDVAFVGILSNPPIRSGKPALHALLSQWLPRLADDGRAHLVVAKNLGSDSLARWLVAEGFPTTRLASQAGFRVLEVVRS